ncbi:MAG: energy-coupling factor transporter transmembrane protein EcfT [Clostridiales Family XIII bacterium]|jgi:energy-coupling factor transport system permease protein|nr:energy-coupling factor transporter transmembrane protein EcfT [Clostridiales Family XIII bacterium]
MASRINPGHAFPNYHPATVFTYIAAVITCAMLTMHPVYVCISFAAGTIYAIYLGGARRYILGLRPLIVMFTFIAIINPLTNHRGGTILFTVGGSPVTFEALLYGLCAGGMLLCVLVWFMCYQMLINNDKFMYLFGRSAPASAMVISMILKFVPVMTVRMREITDARKALGVDRSESTKESDGAFIQRHIRRSHIRDGARASGVLISRSMEDSIETADSMRARGYGSGPRSTFSRYRLKTRDIATLATLIVLFAANIWCVFFYPDATHGQSFRFFPFVYGITLSPLPYVLYATLLLWPFADEAAGRLV